MHSISTGEGLSMPLPECRDRRVLDYRGAVAMLAKGFATCFLGKCSTAMSFSGAHSARAAFIGAAVVAGFVAAAPQPNGTYTPVQAASGKTLYEQRCADCHRADLEGTGHGPALVGEAFLRVWGGRTAGQLIEFTIDSMPPGGASLDENEYVSVVAYILRANGHAPGVPLHADSAVVVGALAGASDQALQGAALEPKAPTGELAVGQSEAQGTNAVLRMRSESPKVMLRTVCKSS